MTDQNKKGLDVTIVRLHVDLLSEGTPQDGVSALSVFDGSVVDHDMNGLRLQTKNLV